MYYYMYLTTPSITSDSNDVNNTSNEVTIYFCVSCYDDKGFLLIKSCTCKMKSNYQKNNQLTSEFYMTSLKLISPIAPKIKCQH